LRLGLALRLDTGTAGGWWTNPANKFIIIAACGLFFDE
jgi:hypothetical protein